jgi:hypothetical protein
MEPKLYDSMCDLDSWLIREKSAVECQGACFKWQQVLNNSGVLSYSTIRDCFERVCFYERQIKDAYIQHYILMQSFIIGRCLIHLLGHQRRHPLARLTQQNANTFKAL